MGLDYTKIATTSFATLGSYAATGGPGALMISSFAAGPVGAAVGLALTGLSVATSLIGRGRAEADIISPVQNQFGSILIAVNDNMTSDSTLTVEQLRALAQITADSYAKFDEFTRNPQFTDGRASVQARDTMRPMVDGRNSNGDVVRQDAGTLGSIQRRIDAISGGGVSSSSSPAAGAGGGGVLLVGGALVAKLLGFF